MEQRLLGAESCTRAACILANEQQQEQGENSIETWLGATTSSNPSFTRDLDFHAVRATSWNLPGNISRIGDFFPRCIVLGISGIHANSDDFPWKSQQKFIMIRVFRPFEYDGFLWAFPRKVVRIRMNSRNPQHNAPGKEVSKCK